LPVKVTGDFLAGIVGRLDVAPGDGLGHLAVVIAVSRGQRQGAPGPQANVDAAALLFLVAICFMWNTLLGKTVVDSAT
jgi:hypothetical protein